MSANYYEIFVLDDVEQKQNENLHTFNVCISDSKFESLLQKLSKDNSKYFAKNIKRYVSGNVFMDVYNDNETKVYTKELIQNIIKDKNTLTLKYNKQKQAYHAFPSTTSLHQISYIRRLTFRIHNRIYLNFDIEHYPHDDSQIKKVFFNCNIDTTTDKNHIDDTLEIYMRLITN